MQDQSGGDVDAGQVQNLSGRAQVRALLIEPLLRDGLIRPPTMRAGDVDAFLAQLAARLAYLDEAALKVLAEVVLGMAEGKLRNQWPSFATIWNFAQRISRQPPPDEERHIMTSWLRSRGGLAPLEGGYLVELHSWLRRFGRPPVEFEIDRIKQDAAENARQLARLVERRSRGVASPDELTWIERYTAQTAYCRSLVEGGARARVEATQAIEAAE